MKKDLEQYLGKLGTMIVDSSVRFAENYMHQVFSMGPGANAVGWDQKKFEDKPASSVDSETGRISTVNPEKIIQEVSEHSYYLMQTIKIGNSEALIFSIGGQISTSLTVHWQREKVYRRFQVSLPT